MKILLWIRLCRALIFNMGKRVIHCGSGLRSKSRSLKLLALFLFLSLEGKSCAQVPFKGNPESNPVDSKKALEHFNKLARENPASAEAHFGRASALIELGREAEAEKEMKLVLLLNPSASLAKSCREKMQSLGIKDETDGGAAESPAPSPASVRGQDVESSISKILQQSEEKIKGIQSDSETYARSIYNSRSKAHDRLIEDLRRESDEFKRNRRVSRFADADFKQSQAEIQFRSQSSLLKARSDYDIRKQEAQLRSLGIKESAEGLESQMTTKPSESSGVFLVPTGTNLYVRNYGHFDPILPEPPEELHAVPIKLPALLSKVQNKKDLHKDKSRLNGQTHQ
ncbi:MAG: tetratricopeptide repeat protein [Candidatus Obscuribacterales bacterium]|nr:tetratricopeptide repeat protein [Candidatus Obscuribacterales bacterium]